MRKGKTSIEVCVLLLFLLLRFVSVLSTLANLREVLGELYNVALRYLFIELKR